MYVVATATAATATAVAAAGDEKGDDEAEYAWLPYHSIKPFQAGDVSGNETGQAPNDAVLQGCVVQAEAALAAANASRGQQEDGTDSDGGWGISREVRGG